MIVLKIFLFIYLFLGAVYATYIAIRGTNEWYWFPINLLFGPITAVYVIYTTYKGKKMRVDF
ncbi:hypothetical protein K0B04_02305 [Patescibacteria group bacterium]|nr:hypothetical protein [Patescibacteria group bacterium]